MTVFPAWAWTLPGLLLAAAGIPGGGKRYAAVLGLAWLAAALFLSAETRGLARLYLRPRPAMSEGPAPDGTIRIVTLNCAGGGLKATLETLPYKPDIVLLQESPRKAEVAEFAKKLYGNAGAFVWGVNTTIVVNGKIIRTGGGPGTPYYSRARVRLRSGTEIEVICYRPPPLPLRYDIWSPGSWKAYAADRRKKRSYMKAIASELGSLPADTPAIVGGDFNVPAGDGSTRELAPLLRDAYKEGGTGHGNTVMNELPVHRFDQLWVSRHFRTVSLIAKETKHSDHRMVIADLSLR